MAFGARTPAPYITSVADWAAAAADSHLAEPAANEGACPGRNLHFEAGDNRRDAELPDKSVEVRERPSIGGKSTTAER